MNLTITGVRTTGIYCRDGCSARPLERNTKLFRSPVAAEAAGFRPCLRCRPDRLPPYVDSDGAGVVARALALIADGVLDDATEDVLAQRLGLTARHLRRLFDERVGATPALVARARRAHFARRLLDESDLRIPAVAQAAGFASVRQMNRVIADVFKFTPVELRNKRRDSDRLVADGGLPLRVPFAGPLDFDALLAHRAARAIPGVESVSGGVYRRTITSCGEPGVIEVSALGDGKHLLMVVHLPTALTLIDDVARARRLFGLDRPPAGQTALARDRVLRAAVHKRPRLRVPGSWDPFETSIRIMLGQQVSVAGATTLAGRLVEAFGSRVPGLRPMGLSHAFPPAARIAEASLARLRAVGMPEARALAIRTFARAYADERIRLDAGATLDEVVGPLASLPGVGPWTAHMIAMQAAAQPDAFPAGDLGLRRAAGLATAGGATLGTAVLESMADAWRPYRALAAMCLWTTLT
jgi:AraC family transcriptional regulator, regulatory protein of adaptative response / DNA-3-methyladenine glycosylase II